MAKVTTSQNFSGARLIGTLSLAQLVPTGTWTEVTLWNNVSYDTDSFILPNDYKFTIPSSLDGNYFISSATIEFANNGTGSRGLEVGVNSSSGYSVISRSMLPATPNLGANFSLSVTSVPIKLLKTNNVTFKVYQDSGGNLALVSLDVFNCSICVV